MAEKNDRLIRFLLPGARARGAIIRAENIIDRANELHGFSGVPGEMFGKALIASILLLSVSKGGMRQVLQLDCIDQAQAPIRRILTEARLGAVRGFLNWSEDVPQSRAHQDEGISAWMGSPIRTSVVRDLGVGHPYISSIEHNSDYLADHILHYLTQSVQIQSDIILHGNIGIMLEAMPGSDQEHWFKAIEAMAKISTEQLNNSSAENILKAFDLLECKIVGEDEYAYHCGCRPESMVSALHTIPDEKLSELADEHGEITLSCQYCNKSYTVNSSTIEK